MIKKFTKQYQRWDDAPAVLTVSEACVLLRMNEDTLRNHLEKGIVPGVKFGRQWRLDREALREKFGGGERNAC